MERYASERRWSGGHVFTALVIGLGVGLFGGYHARGSGGTTTARPAPEGNAMPAPATPPPAGSGAPGTDSFGRAPGDEHFGHNHPSNQGHGSPAAPAPTGTGPDKFGRQPGAEHYGHDHP